MCAAKIFFLDVISFIGNEKLAIDRFPEQVPINVYFSLRDYTWGNVSNNSLFVIDFCCDNSNSALAIILLKSSYSYSENLFFFMSQLMLLDSVLCNSSLVLVFN